MLSSLGRPTLGALSRRVWLNSFISVESRGTMHPCGLSWRSSSTDDFAGDWNDDLDLLAETSTKSQRKGSLAKDVCQLTVHPPAQRCRWVGNKSRKKIHAKNKISLKEVTEKVYGQKRIDGESGKGKSAKNAHVKAYRGKRKKHDFVRPKDIEVGGLEQAVKNDKKTTKVMQDANKTIKTVPSVFSHRNHWWVMWMSVTKIRISNKKISRPNLAGKVSFIVGHG